LFQVWEVFINAILEDEETFFSRLNLSLQVLSQMFFTVPKHIVNTLYAVLTVLS